MNDRESSVLPGLGLIFGSAIGFFGGTVIVTYLFYRMGSHPDFGAIGDWFKGMYCCGVMGGLIGGIGGYYILKLIVSRNNKSH